MTGTEYLICRLQAVLKSTVQLAELQAELVATKSELAVTQESLEVIKSSGAQAAAASVAAASQHADLEAALSAAQADLALAQAANTTLRDEKDSQVEAAEETTAEVRKLGVELAGVSAPRDAAQVEAAVQVAELEGFQKEVEDGKADHTAHEATIQKVQLRSCERKI